MHGMGVHAGEEDRHGPRGWCHEINPFSTAKTSSHTISRYFVPKKTVAVIKWLTRSRGWFDETKPSASRQTEQRRASIKRATFHFEPKYFAENVRRVILILYAYDIFQ